MTNIYILFILSICILIIILLIILNMYLLYFIILDYDIEFYKKIITLFFMLILSSIIINYIYNTKRINNIRLIEILK
ncbi:hypothetical protein [Alphaentomopoxvirus acuprea]|uniref:Uncharacterized protein n=1 Tax=Alphaentomopoxvirus acuprea TaxID=62099 RepID=W6JLM1_9POXV|nr:hypothetical protein BA82_gp181 [Anomala cuprea entomopoxvirus]BAO49541.1 hypothetical protein [Anomala cuprea entomopoxvirus]